MSPSETDVEFRSLGPDAGGSVELLCIVLQCFVELLRIGKDYELIQAYISLFLKVRQSKNSNKITFLKFFTICTIQKIRTICRQYILFP